MPFWKRSILIVLLMMVSMLMALPAISLATIDYSKPKTVRWIETKQSAAKENHEREVAIVFDTSDSLDRLSALAHTPLRLSLWTLILLTLFVTMVFVIWVANSYNENKPFWLWMLATVIMQFIVCLGSIGACIANESIFDISERVTNSIVDKELAARLIQEAHVQLGWVPLRVIGSFVVWDIFILLGGAGIGALIQSVIASYTNYKASLLKELGGDDHPLALRQDGSIDLLTYEYRLRCTPFPAVVPQCRVSNTLPWSEWFPLLGQHHSTVTLESLCREFKISLADLFDAVGTQTSQRIITVIGDGLRNGMKSTLEKSLATNAQKRFAQATQLLQNVSDATLQRFQQDMVAHIGEAVRTHMDEFRQQATSFLRLKAGSMDLFVPSDAAFPDGTKFCFSKGKTTLFVVEERPQLRTLMFSRSFLRGEGASCEGDTSVQLAFPYVIFVVKLIEGRFSYLYVYFSKQPIRSMTDPMCYLTLPNTYSDGQVCIGSFDPHTSTCADCVRAVISYFWQSRFTDDLTGTYKRGCKPFEDIHDWQTRSKQPGFALVADWQQSNQCLQQIVEMLLSTSEDQALVTAEQAVRQSLDRAIQSLDNALEHACSTIVVSKRYPKRIAKELATHLQSLGTNVLACMVAHLDATVATTNGKVRLTFDEHLQQAVNEVVVGPFLTTAASTLLRDGQLPEKIYRTLEERSTK